MSLRPSSARTGVRLSIDPGAPGQAELEAMVPAEPSAEPGLALHLHRSGAIVAEALPLALADARLRLPTWTRATLSALLGPRVKSSWRDAVNETFSLEGAELVAMAGHELLPLAAIALQVERPFDDTVSQPGRAWAQVAPWLVERYPATLLMQVGRRVAALVPGLGMGQLPEAASELKGLLDTHEPSTRVGLGFASFPDDARELGPLMRLAEGAAMRASSTSERAVTRGAPVLLLVGERLPVHVADSGLLHRLDVQLVMRGYDSALEFLQREYPTAALVDLAAPAPFLDALAQVVRRERVPHTRLIFVSRDDVDDALKAAFARFPQSSLVAGRDRLTGRTLEEVAQSLGLKPRRYLRRGHELALTVELAGRTVAGRLLNISESGARLVVEAAQLDELSTLRFELPAGAVVAATKVVWHKRSSAECEVGVRFESLSDGGRAIIGDFVGRPDDPEPVRSAPRFEVAKKLKLKLRVKVRPSGATHYLALLDLAEGGARSEGVSVPELVPGAVADLHFFGPSGHFSCVAEVVRRAPSTRGAEYAWRFTDLQRESYSELHRLLRGFDSQTARKRA